MLTVPKIQLSAAAQEVAIQLNLALKEMDGGAVIAAIRASPEAARELLSQKPEAGGACQQGMERLMVTARSVKEAQKLAALRRGLIGFLELHGWTMTKKFEQDMVLEACKISDPQGLEWLARRGVFDAELEAALVKNDVQMVRAFASERARDLKALAGMVACGALVDAPGRVGWTDFASSGLHASAQLLGDHGFKPRDQVLGPRAAGTGAGGAVKGMSAVCAFLCGALRSGLGTPEKLALCFKRLSGLKEAGAAFAGVEAKDPLKDPLATAARFGGIERSRHEMAGYFKLLQELVRLGADPNASGAFLSNETDKELKSRGLPHVSAEGRAQSFVSHALEIGADPTRDAGRSLMACLSTSGITEGARLRMFQTLVKKGCKLPCEHEGDPPTVLALNLEMFDLALCVMEHGDDAGWRGRGGESVLSVLCAKMPQEPGPAREWVQRFLLDPQVAATIDELGPDATEVAGAKPEGRVKTVGRCRKVTALAQACARGSLGAVEALIAAGADVNKCGPSGVRPLATVGLAMAPGEKRWGAWQLEIVEKLLASGADPAAVDAQGCAPLQALAGSLVFDACALLARLHPHVFGSDPHGMKACGALAVRGERGRSIVELGEMLVASSTSLAPSRASARPRI